MKNGNGTLDCEDKCFKEEITLWNLLNWPINKICSDNSTECNKISIDLRGFKTVGFHKELATTDPMTITFIAAVSAGATLAIVGIVIGILR